MAQNGQFNWVFADGKLPYREDAHERCGYESITVTNLNDTSAHLTFDIYFSDRAPIKGLTFTLEAERVNCFRLDMPFCDQKYNIPSGQYSLVLHSDVPVVASFARLDAGQKNTAYYTVQGYTY